MCLLQLLSLGMDGKILKWEVKLSRYEEPQLVLVQGFVITGSYIPRDHPSAPSNRNSDIGGMIIWTGMINSLYDLKRA